MLCVLYHGLQTVKGEGGREQSGRSEKGDQKREFLAQKVREVTGTEVKRKYGEWTKTSEGK